MEDYLEGERLGEVRHEYLGGEVPSPETERIDRREKFWGYQHIESLETYVLIAQDRHEVTVFHRANGWKPEILRRPDDSIAVPALDFTLRLSDLYEGLVPGPSGLLEVRRG